VVGSCEYINVPSCAIKHVEFIVDFDDCTSFSRRTPLYGARKSKYWD
jgi:hypothetical protein